MGWQMPQDRFTQVDGLRTRYWMVGESGPPLVLVHGFGGFAENWVENVFPLGERFRVFALDLPGHGQTEDDPQASYTIEYFADFVAHFMDTLGLDRAHVAGHSLGGAVVIALTHRHSARVDHMILANSAGVERGMSLGMRLMTIPLLGERLIKPSRNSLRRLYASYVYDPSMVPDELIETAYRYAAPKTAQQVLLKALRVGASWRGIDRALVDARVASLAEIPQPTLIIWGREDQVTPLSSGHLLAGRLPTAELHIIERCGHLSLMDHPDEFNALITDFLA